MAYLPSTYIQQKGISKRVLKQITTSKISKTITSENSKNETAKYALGDQGSLTTSAGSSKQLQSPIYVHETRHILTKIPSTSSNTQNKKNNNPIEHETSNVFHDCGNHNHQRMTQSTLPKLLRAAYAKAPFPKRKLPKSSFPVDDNRQISKESLIQVEETYWMNWKPSTTSNQKPKSSYKKKQPKNIKTKSTQNSKVTASFLQGSNIPRKNTQKTASLFQYSKNKFGKESHPLPPRFNDQELKIFPTLSVKTDLTYYSQEFETNRVDYDESLLFSRRKRESSASSSISTKTDNLKKNSEPVSLRKEEVESDRVLTDRSQPTDKSPTVKSQVVVTFSDHSSVISKSDTKLIPNVAQNSQTNIENSTASKKSGKSLIHSLPSSKNSQKTANSKRKLKEQSIEPHYAAESDNEEITELKHTDSLILACNKKSREKPYLQQPKAIRLFKRSVSTKTAKIKSPGPILKKDTSPSKKSPLIRLGKPGSPVVLSSKFSRKSK
ncbi:uncharacterized protein LOC108737986 [Agrilus planipennis]|uniref:Uncharacterized protein LOC108737986 n=1 Tax=Agrilus planipennis TaxID=224129 RepID=A0A1W4X1P1_AGRPL|nr:uncharacterized protein LOC108737986 [Agrilus planipennis]